MGGGAWGLVLEPGWGRLGGVWGVGGGVWTEEPGWWMSCLAGCGIISEQ